MENCVGEVQDNWMERRNAGNFEALKEYRKVRMKERMQESWNERRNAGNLEGKKECKKFERI